MPSADSRRSSRTASLNVALFGRGYPANVSQPPERAVALVTLGCARNEVDSEELAGRLDAGGWTLTDADDADDRASSTPAGSSTRPRRTRSTPSWRGRHRQEGRRRRLPCRALRRRTRGVAARGRRGARIRLLRRHRRPTRRCGGRPGGGAARPARPAPLLPVAPAQRPAAVADVAVPGHAWLPDRTRSASTTRRSPTSSSRPGAIVAARSAPSRPSAARSCPGRRREVLDEARWLA